MIAKNQNNHKSFDKKHFLTSIFSRIPDTFYVHIVTVANIGFKFDYNSVVGYTFTQHLLIFVVINNEHENYKSRNTFQNKNNGFL